LKKARFVIFLLLAYLAFSENANPSETLRKQKIPQEQFNLLLITIDTLRSDRLSCYDNKHLKTPNIDSLAKRGVLFTRAFAHTSTTLPSHTNILLGTTPPYHGVHDNSNFIVRENLLTLAEYLKQHGYVSGAFVGAYPLDRRFGLTQGFDIYDDNYEMRETGREITGEREAQVVVDRAIEWLKANKQPWFLWIHCYDPHDPYTPPEPYRTLYAKCPYDGEVAYVDSVIGKLFQFLDDNQLPPKTVIVFTGDHGESLDEHGEKTHGFFAYNSTLWVPLIISVPGIKAGRVHQNVCHTDIFPTVCDALQIEKPKLHHGISLLHVMKGKKLKTRSIYFESLSPHYTMGWAPITGYIYKNDKFIGSPIPELFNLDKDFAEIHNLANEKIIDTYRKRLDQLIYSQFSEDSIRAEKGMDKTTLEKLQSLGYIASYKGTRKEKFGPEDDVKVLLPYHNKSNLAYELFAKGNIREGIELLKEVITEKKNVSLAYVNLAKLYANAGRPGDAIEVMKMGMEYLPASYTIFSEYIGYLYEAKRFDEVIQTFESKNFIETEFDPSVWNYVGLTYWKTTNEEKAKGCYEKSISIDRKFPLPYNNLGTYYLSIYVRTKNSNDLQKAFENFKKAIELDPYYSMPYNGLGMVYLQQANYPEAITSLKRALEITPDFDEPLYHLGIAYMRQYDYSTAYMYFERFINSPTYIYLSPKAKAILNEYMLMCSPRPQPH